MAKSISIGLLFEREENGTFTSKALMRQDILRYAIELRRSLEEVPLFPKLPLLYVFKETPLLNWIVDCNFELQAKYQGTPYNQASKVQKSRTQISGRLNDLMSLGLVVQMGTTIAEKTREEIPQFGFSPSGVLLAYLVDNINRETIEHIDTIFNIALAYTWGVTAQRIFLNSFFKRSMERGLFKTFVENFVNNLKDTTINFDEYGPEAMVMFMSNIFSRDPSNGLDRRVAELWLEALEAMDGESKQLFLYNLKQRLESRHSFWDIMRETEIIRRNSASEYSKIVIELLCPACVKTSALTVEVTDLVRYTFLARQCPKCQKEDALAVPIERFVNDLI